MEMTGEKAKEGHKELKQRMLSALTDVRALPRVADEKTAAHLDDLLQRRLAYLTVQVGTRLPYKHGWFVVVRIDWPYLVLELVEISRGHEHQTETIAVGERMLFHSAYWVVRQIVSPYAVVECTGITEKLEQKITRGQVAKQLADSGKTTVKVGKGSVKIRKRSKQRWGKKR
jgi:hypothetical protein